MPKAKTAREKIEALTPTDREILDLIGAGQESGYVDAVCKRLERQGLIVKLGMKTISKDCFGLEKVRGGLINRTDPSLTLIICLRR